MNSNAQFERFSGSVPAVKVAYLGEKVEGQRGDFGCVVVSVADGQTAGHHVSVADRFHFVGVVILQDGVEQSVELVEQTDDLERSAGRRQRRESHDVTEVDRHRIETLRLDGLSSFQRFNYRSD